jgi:hypothetical protein
MASLTGQTVSHYKILDHLGDNGMGGEDKAKDTRLNRTVVMKLLSELSSRRMLPQLRIVRIGTHAGAWPVCRNCSADVCFDRRQP